MGYGQGHPVKASVLSIHDVQVFGFNDSGQQVVAGVGWRVEGEHWVRQGRGHHSSPPTGPGCPPQPATVRPSSSTGWGSWRS